MTVARLLPTSEARELVQLAADVADKVLDPIVDEHERSETYPEGVFSTLGETGLLTLPHPEEWGGGGQPYEVYLQVLEELAARWAAVAVAVSVHVLSCHPLIAFGTTDQQQTWLPAMLGGQTIGAYSLSEPQAGSDAAALTCKATPVDGGYHINGAKAWITHGGVADFYSLFARTGEGGQRISCFLVDKDTDGLTFGAPEQKMGLHAIPTTTAHYDDAFVAESRRIGAEGQGLQIAFSALDSGRLGIAAVAVGLAQAALDEAVTYAQQRTTFGRRIIDHQGLAFLLADMAAAIDSARATYVDAARRRDAGLPYSRNASIAKLVATDAAMKVTTDAIQGFRRLRIHPRLPCGAIHARGQDHPDLRGHQPDPAPGHRPVAQRHGRQVMTADAEYQRPQMRLAPSPTAESHAFWTGGQRDQLLINRCHACGHFFHPPGPACWRCRSTDVAPEPVSGRATVAAYTVNRQNWIPGFEPPYVVAIVELDDEPDVRLITNVVGVPLEDVGIGMAVEVFFEDWTALSGDEDSRVWIPLFRPVQSATA